MNIETFEGVCEGILVILVIFIYYENLRGLHS